MNQSNQQDKKLDPVNFIGLRTFLPDACVWVFVGILVLLTIIITKNASALWALFFPAVTHAIHIIAVTVASLDSEY